MLLESIDFTFGLYKFKELNYMKLRLLRNATLFLESDNGTLLIDPMFSAKGELGAFPYLDDKRENPLVDLPVTNAELELLVSKVDAILLTHSHPDHWDVAAQNMLPKDIPVFCQIEDRDMLQSIGFTNVTPVFVRFDFKGFTFYRTDGKHGIGQIGELMGKVSGFIIEQNEERIYIAGDTVWCSDVSDAIAKYTPNHIVINGGAAQFSIGDHVTMNRDDLLKIYQYYPQANYYIVHLETVTPVVETRERIKVFLKEASLSNKFIVPDDGAYLF